LSFIIEELSRTRGGFFLMKKSCFPTAVGDSQPVKSETTATTRPPRALLAPLLQQQAKQACPP
jgi:hypothetical protein